MALVEWAEGKHGYVCVCVCLSLNYFIFTPILTKFGYPTGMAGGSSMKEWTGGPRSLGTPGVKNVKQCPMTTKLGPKNP